MTPEIQVMVQATQFIMTGLQALYGLLGIMLLVACGYHSAELISEARYGWVWKSPKFERVVTAVKLGFVLGGLILAIGVFV